MYDYSVFSDWFLGDLKPEGLAGYLKPEVLVAQITGMRQESTFLTHVPRQLNA
jgi:hypothetical protein